MDHKIEIVGGIYSRLLNTVGFNCVGPLLCGCFPVNVNVYTARTWLNLQMQSRRHGGPTPSSYVDF